jgi:hypothetical protein
MQDQVLCYCIEICYSQSLSNISLHLCFVILFRATSLKKLILLHSSHLFFHFKMLLKFTFDISHTISFCTSKVKKGKKKKVKLSL